MAIVLRLTRISLLLLISAHSSALMAQEPNTPSRIELGVQFSSLNYSSIGGGAGLSVASPVEAGFGGRFTLNLNRHVALEAEGNFFPHPRVTSLSGGRALQAQLGVKAGQRFKHFGVFGKARPGLLSFGDSLQYIEVPGQPFFDVLIKRRQFFSLDIGGVIEFYPSRRILTRIDVGDTMIRNGPAVPYNSSFPSATSRFTHNLQVSAGIGFRLLAPAKSENEAPSSSGKPRRFEVGAQFSSLGLSDYQRIVGPGLPFLEFKDVRTQAGVGGRITYNLNRNLALEAESNFFPRTVGQINQARGNGRILQVQFGIKAGKRYSRFGVFAKARPGTVSFSRVPRLDGFSDGPFGTMIDFHYERLFYLSADVGGVLEFYPSHRLVTRFDAGDTIIRYRNSRLPSFLAGPTIIEVSPETRHNFQFSTGVGFRF